MDSGESCERCEREEQDEAKGPQHDNSIQGDREALDGSMLGSQDKDKAFSVDGDKISFEMSIMGTTKTVRLEKA